MTTTTSSNDDNNDNNDNDIIEIPSGTIKLTETGNNTFTLTLTGGLTWRDISDFYIANIHNVLEFDGEVTVSEGTTNTGEIRHDGISNTSNFFYTATRTSDTVATVVMSQYHSSYYSQYTTYIYGSGKVKLRDLSTRPSEYEESIGAYFVSQNTTQGWEAVPQSYSSTLEAYAKAEGKLTIADDSGSANFDIPKYAGD
jgi:hypothetical protein